VKKFPWVRGNTDPSGHKCNAGIDKDFPSPHAIVNDIRIICRHSDSGWASKTKEESEELSQLKEVFAAGEANVSLFAEFAMRIWVEAQQFHYLGIGLRTRDGDEVWFSPNERHFLGVGIHWDPCMETLADYSDMDTVPDLGFDIVESRLPIFHCGCSLVTWIEAWTFAPPGTTPSGE
jgi:hypothetical protein